MIPQLSNALSKGFTTKQIIDFLLKKFPNHADKIKSAMAAGFTADQIIKFLSGGNKALHEETELSTEFEETRGINVKQRENVNKAGLIAGGLGATALASPMVAQALKHALPQSLLGTIQQPSQQEQAISPEIIKSQTSQPPVVQPNIPQQQQPIQPEVKTIDIGSLLDKSGLKKHVDELSDRVKDPKQIAAILYNKFPEEMKSFQKQSGKNMEDAIGDYLEQNPVSKESLPIQPEEKATEQQQEKVVPDLGQMGKGITENLYKGLFDSLKQGKDTFAGIKDPALAKAKPAFDAGLIKSPKDLQEFLNKPKIEKSSIVASSNGVGEVKEIRNGQALINVDGKLHKVKEEELIQSPLPEKDLADLYDDLIGGIEKESGQQVSRNVYWSGYDPNTNELAYIPHDGGLYVYDNISPEDAKELTSILSQRKSTGQNYIGVWEKGSSSPIGAKMYQLIQRLQKERGGKGNEYSNKFLKIYDALEPAKSAAKKKYEERKKKAKKPRAY